MKEYKVNDYITLKLENGRTNIYLKGKLFRQCKYLLLINPQEKEEQWNITSIDEAKYKLNSQLEKKIKIEDLEISPEQEFWGHCSNIESWYEQNYNTRFLHSNLAFPLLEKLSKIGDLMAQTVFKEELIKRMKEFDFLEFFIDQGYLAYLSQEDLFDAVLWPNEANIMIEISKLIERKFTLLHPKIERKRKCFFFVKNGQVSNLEIDLTKNYPTIPKIVGKLHKLTHLRINIRDTEKIKLKRKLNSILNLKIFSFSKVIIPNTFTNFPNLQILEISGNFRNSNKELLFSENPDTIGQLKSLRKLYISNINLEQIPESFKYLNKLETLFIKNTDLKSIPNSILNIKSLR